jgi:hypothetical protein
MPLAKPFKPAKPLPKPPVSKLVAAMQLVEHRDVIDRFIDKVIFNT